MFVIYVCRALRPDEETMKKLVEIIKDETIEALKVVDPKLARKLTTLEKKMNVCEQHEYNPVVSIGLSFFAVFEMFVDELVIEKVQDEPAFARYSVTFINGSIEDIKIFINFSKD